MFKRRRLFFLAVLFSFFFPVSAISNEAVFPEFDRFDRVLVIAPHPDDESLGLAGAMQRALAAGSEVKVAYLTNGELNEISSLFYRKRPLLVKSDFIKNGLIRKKESIAAMTFLGLSPDKLIFLGYPDGGMLNIWVKHWGKEKPFRSFFTRLNKVPYKESFSPGNYYRGDEIIRDLEKIFLSFQPTHVFVTAPFDLHPDHQAAYLYSQTALMNVSDQLKPGTNVYLYVIHAHRWPEIKKHLPQKELSVPAHIDWRGAVNWRKFSLSSEETQKKSDAILRYKSQISYKKNFLLSFARCNEVFADYPKDKIESDSDQKSDSGFPKRRDADKGIIYELDGKFLMIQVPLANSPDEMGLLVTYVFGYKKGFLFSEMPKLVFKVFGNKLFVRDKNKPFHDPELVYKIDSGTLYIKIPLRVLKNPDYLFVSSRNAKEDMALDFGSWRLLEVVKSPGKTSEPLL